MKFPLLLALAVLSFLPRFGHAEDKAGLSERVKKQYGDQCMVLEECGDLLNVDCGSAYDGPMYFLNKDTLEKVMACGGVCMTPKENIKGINCTQCPPHEWLACKGSKND